MAARKRLKKKAVEVVQTVPLRHRFPEDDDPSPYHDGRDPDAADEDSDDEEEPTWADYKETFYEVVVQYPMEQHRNAQQLRALDEKLMDDVSLLRRECETYVRAAGKGRKQVLDRLRAGAGELVKRIKQRRLDESASQTPIGLTTSRGETVEGVGLVAPEAAELPQLLDGPSLTPVVDTSAASPAWENGNAVASSSRLGAFNHTSAPVQVEPVLPSQAARRPPSFAAILALRRQNPITASEKISLATDAYDKTDRHIRTLDSELEAHTLAGRHVPDLNKSGAGVGLEHESIELDDDDDDEGSVLEVQARPARSKKVNGGPSSKKSSSDKFLDMGRDGGDDVDTSGLTGEAKVRAALSAPGVVLLPGEPNYCFCNLPSWGKMLGCDNNDCEREWFHPDCLGFSQTEIPTGEWYCPECRPLFKNNGQRAKKRRLI